MKALSSTMKKVVTLVLAMIVCFSAFACKDDPTSSSSSANDNSSSSYVPAPVVTIAVESSSDTIEVGQEVTLTVTVENATDPSYTWSVDEKGMNLVQIADNVLTVKEDVEIAMDTDIVLTATLNEDARIKASKTIRVIAPVVEGRVGELTSEMIEAIGNPSITVSGTLTDVYYSNYYPQLNGNTVYDMTVEMEEGKWRGVWNAREAGANSQIEDVYRRGEKYGITDYSGNVGHALERLYIDMKNEVAVSTVKDYMSIPAVWESQHLWNHLGNLNVNKFKHDVENNLYVYTVDQNDMDSLYLMTYLSISLTPMLSDTLVEIAFVVEDGAITKLIGKTERDYENLDEQTGEFSAYSDTIIEVTFSNVGSTNVKDPTPFSAPANAEVLESALAEMRNAKNYTFNTVDTQTSAPSGNGDDYEFSVTSVSTGDATTYGVPVQNTSTGKIGTVGYVTEDKILLHETGKYSYGMDDKLYYHTYTGYVQNTDGTYEYFENKGSTLTGKRKYEGNMFDAMPGFDFTANIFDFAGMEIEVIGSMNIPVYKFVLRETSITREVAMELITDGKDGKSNVTSDLTIWVADWGNGSKSLYKTQVPYDLVSGTYMGYYTTTFAKLGTTTIPADYFEGYVPRVIAKTWAETETMYYYDGDNNTQNVIDATYGAAGKDLPTPVMLFEAFGDCMNGPFYDWKEMDEVDSDGNKIKKGWISVNLSLDDSLVDENTRIIDFDAAIAKIREVFISNGFTESAANTDLSGGASGHGSKYITFVKGDIMVAIENNNTRFFFIDFYTVGMWTLNR